MHIVPQAGNCGKETRAKQQEKTDPAGEQQNPFHHAGSELIMGTEQENALHRQLPGFPFQPVGGHQLFDALEAAAGTR